MTKVTNERSDILMNIFEVRLQGFLIAKFILALWTRMESQLFMNAKHMPLERYLAFELNRTLVTLEWFHILMN